MEVIDMDTKSEILQLKREISEQSQLIDQKKTILARLERQMMNTAKEIKKNDPYIGKYYKQVSETVIWYHPQEYGEHYTSFDWVNNIVYEGLYCTYKWKGTTGTGFSFDLQQPIDQRHLISDFVEVTKEEFEEGVKQFMNDILEIVKTDTYHQNDTEARKGIYETVKAKNKWL
jgi:hypothetical protein